MTMLPTTGDDLELMAFRMQEQPGRTHRLDMNQDRTSGITDKRDAVLQAVYLALNVERYAYPIYSRNYGAELADLIGRPSDYVMSEMKRRITEALEQDDRITSVGNWEFEACKNKVRAEFTVTTIYGELPVQKEVAI